MQKARKKARKRRVRVYCFRNNLARQKLTSKISETNLVRLFYVCFKGHGRRVFKNNLGIIQIL